MGFAKKNKRHSKGSEEGKRASLDAKTVKKNAKG